MKFTDISAAFFGKTAEGPVNDNPGPDLCPCIDCAVPDIASPEVEAG